MISKCIFVLTSLLFPLFCTFAENNRQFWVETLVRISDPVLRYAAKDSLKIVMPVYNDSTRDFQYLEALGRTICGIAPWLELDNDTTEESTLREIYRDYAIQAIGNAVNPKAKDYMNFSEGNQPLVDAAYLALGLLRAPSNLFHKLDGLVQQRVIMEMKKTRSIKPGQNNWLLFASVVEAFLLEYTGEYDESRLMGGVSFLDRFYHGDGMYGDGRYFAMDYYNSFVIHPMLTEVIHVGVKHKLNKFEVFDNIQTSRLRRYACIQERMISPEGTYPVIGRTLICRIGAFHALAEAAWLEILPENLSPGQVRAAMTSVLKRQFSGNQNFGEKDFLTIGFCGSQRDFTEKYVSSGSPYHCTTFFLPLGLDPNSDFWKLPSEKWTSMRAFSGEEFISDHSYKEESSLINVGYYKYLCLSLKVKIVLYMCVGLCLFLNFLGLCYLYQKLRRR